MNVRILVVGAGIVGIACALELQRRGAEVIIVDRAPPAEGCSFGNAGIIATSETFPLITPARLKQLPSMLLRRDGPVVLRVGAAGRALPWFARAALTLSAERQASIAGALGILNRRALPAWRALLGYAEASHLLVERGMLELVRDPRECSGLIERAKLLSEMGLAAHMLSGNEVRELEPTLGPASVGAILHEGTAHVTDPYRTAKLLMEAFRAGGGQLAEDLVLRTRPTESGIEISGKIHRWNVDHCVVATGLASAALLRPYRVRVPLLAERGYHLMLPDAASALSRPVTFHAESCVATPLSGGLRIAGTVEFAHEGAVPDWTRAERLKEFAGRYFRTPLSTCGSTRWLGSRPSLPDSLPAIGRLEAEPRIAYAFGHQHLGLTQAAATAEIIADMLAGQGGRNVSAYRIERF